MRGSTRGTLRLALHRPSEGFSFHPGESGLALMATVATVANGGMGGEGHGSCH